MTISIRPAATIKDCRVIEQLQLEIWGFQEIEVVPDHLLLTLAKEGNSVLLAVKESGEPVGFAFGFLAYHDDHCLKLASHQVGVLPAYQNKGVGYALKLAQRQAALTQNLELITWTFDPLQARNAYLNFNKLGAVCNTYLPHLYGEMRDQVNQGLPSDRFRVDWWIATKRVADCLAGFCPIPAGSPILNATATRLPGGWRVPAKTFDLPHETACRVEVPSDLQALKSGAPEIARQWRLHTRQVFQTAFTAGYTVVALLRQADRNYYLLQKDWQPEARMAGGTGSGIERSQ